MTSLKERVIERVIEQRDNEVLFGITGHYILLTTYKSFFELLS